MSTWPTDAASRTLRHPPPEDTGLSSLLIKNARLIDGVGSPAASADIAVENDLITEAAPDLDIDADQVIDAAGSVASPGFIDMHSHGGAGIIERTTADSKALDGVTTEVLKRPAIQFVGRIIEGSATPLQGPDGVTTP